MRHRINFSTTEPLPTEAFVGSCANTGEVVEGPFLSIIAHVAKSLAIQPFNSWRVMREWDWHGE